MVKAVEDTVMVAVAVPPEVSGMIRLLPVEVELLRVIVGPFARNGTIVKLSFTFPARVFKLARLMVEELVEPKGTTSEAGLRAMLKSGFVTAVDTWTALDAVPTVPVVAIV